MWKRLWGSRHLDSPFFGTPEWKGRQQKSTGKPKEPKKREEGEQGKYRNKKDLPYRRKISRHGVKKTKGKGSENGQKQKWGNGWVKKNLGVVTNVAKTRKKGGAPWQGKS